ncbi:unnamed protein product [Boreogadus saida]
MTLNDDATMELPYRAPHTIWYEDREETQRQWENAEDHQRSNFFEVVVLLTSERTRRVNQPTRHRLI